MELPPPRVFLTDALHGWWRWIAAELARHLDCAMTQVRRAANKNNSNTVFPPSSRLEKTVSKSWFVCAWH